MCTVIILSQLRADLPVVIAANRDEYYARPASGPGAVAGALVAGVDQRGGTWLGVSPGGFLCAVTNQRDGSLPEPTRESRGALVLRVLELAGLPPGLAARAYNPFNLLFGDARGLQVAYGRDDLAVEAVPPGLHVLLNGRLDETRDQKRARIRSLVEPLVALPWPELAAGLQRALADHELPLLDAICIHTPVFGTRSSSIVALAPGRVAHFLNADGPPCRTPFSEVGRPPP